MKKNPCINCADRGCGNHANCEKYMEFFNENRKAGEQRARGNPAEAFQIKTGERIKKRRRKNH